MIWGATVTNIVDGDTFDVVWDNGYEPPNGLLDRIRIAGIDTNETSTNQSFSAEATQRLAELIPVGTHVMLEAQDANSNSQGRPVRHVFVDDVNVANVLLEEGLGLAVSYEYEPDYRDEYFASGESAKLAGVGMWAEGASGGDPATWSDIEMFVNYDAGGDDNLNLNDEYIHIQNNGPFQLDMTGWTFRKSGKPTTTEIPDGTILDVGETFRIYTGSGTDTANKMYLGMNNPFWDNIDDVIYLRDEHLNIRGYQAWPDSIFTGSVSSIVIDDVQYNAPGADDATNPNGEWVQIRNAGHETVDLANWRLKDNSADYVFGDGETLDPGETLKIFIGSGSDSNGIRYWGKTTGILNNDSGKLEIWTPYSQAVDAYVWGNEDNTNEDPRGAIRMFANFDGPGSDTTNPNNEWVALENTSDSAIDLSNYSLKSGSHTYTFANGTTLAADANMRVMVGNGTDSTNIKFWGKSSGILSNSGDKVDLIDDEDEILLRHEWSSDAPAQVTDYGIVIDKVNFDAIGSDTQNPNGEWLTIRNASSSEQNLLNWKIVVGPKQLVILEDRPLDPGETITVYMGSGTNTENSIYWGEPSGILYNSGSRAVELMSPNRDVVETHSWGSATSSAQSVAAAVDMSINYDAAGADADNPNGEWVNLNNLSSSDISLNGYHLYTDGTSYLFDSNDVIDAGERMRVYLGSGTDSGLKRYANGDLNTFNNTADEVELRRNDTGGAVDSFAYPFNSQPLITGDFKITAVNYDVPGVDDANPNGEWIELTNTGSKSAGLRDWRVQYQTGTFFDFNEDVTVSAGDTIRIHMGTGTNTTTNFYWGNTTAALSNTSGNLSLQSNYRAEAHTFAWRTSPTNEDTINGTDGDNTLKTFGGNDTLFGAGGNDELHGGDDNDTIYGNEGDDIFYGGNGDDKLYGGADNDKLYGGNGDDYIKGHSGEDYLKGHSGEDYLRGGDGDDLLKGGSDDDLLKGEDEDDTIYGEDGNDVFYGGNGDDKLYGGSGDDKLYGGADDDYIKGHSGEDYLKGHSGEDYLRGGDDDDLLKGGSGDDLLKGENDDDTIYGEDGNDTLYGGGGGDLLDGGSGNDFLDGGGGSGTDKLYGGADADVFHFDRGEGKDIVYDFENNVDTIEFDNFSYLNNANDALNYATQVGSDAVFDFGSDGSLTVEDTTLSALQNDIEIV